MFIFTNLKSIFFRQKNKPENLSINTEHEIVTIDEGKTDIPVVDTNQTEVEERDEITTEENSIVEYVVENSLYKKLSLFEIYNIIEPTMDTLNIMAYIDLINTFFKVQEDPGEMNYPYLYYAMIALPIFNSLLILHRLTKNAKLQNIIFYVKALTTFPSTLVLNMSTLSWIGAVVLAAFNGGKFVKDHWPEYIYYPIVAIFAIFSLIAVFGPLGVYNFLLQHYPRREKLIKFFIKVSAGTRDFSKANGAGNSLMTLVTTLTNNSLKEKHFWEWLLSERLPVSVLAFLISLIMLFYEFGREYLFIKNGMRKLFGTPVLAIKNCLTLYDPNQDYSFRVNATRNLLGTFALGIINGSALFAMHQQNDGPGHATIDATIIILGLIILAPLVYLLLVFFGPLLKKLFQCVTTGFSCCYSYEEIKPFAHSRIRTPHYASIQDKEVYAYESDGDESSNIVNIDTDNKDISCSVACARLAAWTSNTINSWKNSLVSHFRSSKANELSVPETTLDTVSVPEAGSSSNETLIIKLQ